MAPRVSENYKRKKKNQLLQAARDVFIKKGYTHATMQDIMDEAKVSRGGLYSYFHNIEHVFMEVLQFDDQNSFHFFELADDSLIWKQMDDWIQQQKKVIETIDHSLLQARSEFFLSSNYKQNKANFPYVKERFDQAIEVITAFIEKGVKQNEFQPRLSPDAIARFIIFFIDGLMLDTFQLGSERTNVEEQLEALEISLKQMLCPVNIKNVEER